MAFNVSSINHINLSKPSSLFGLKLWVAIVICIVLALLFVLIFTLAYIFWRSRRKGHKPSKHAASKNLDNVYRNCSMDRRLLLRNGLDIEMSIGTPEKQVMYSDQRPGNGEINGDDGNNVTNVESVASEKGPVSLYTLRAIEAATNGLAYENVIGSGQYGVVYHGFLMDNTEVAVKNLFSNSFHELFEISWNTRRGKKSFSREAEAMLLIRHKNLVKLLGYFAEGACRMLVYEYVDNGNLKQWLHQCISKVSPLTWNVRMKIIIGIAKGLAYLHEDADPPVVHRNLKSSNILVDQQWNPKISDIGITKLLGPQWNHTTAPPTGMSGYIAPEYDSIRALDEKSDVYSFGTLIMEIVSGKATIELTVNEIEEYLVDWVKSMVAEKNFDLILDPKLPELPTIKELKRILLIALRCVDFEVDKRPKMGEIIHMLEPRDLLLCDEHVIKRQISRSHSSKAYQLS